MPKESRTTPEKMVIFHVDMDQFYAAVEEREHSELRGRPVIVGANPKEGKGRGVVSPCNYEARKYSIHSGMPISRAWKLCPDAIYLQPNYKLYIQASSRIMNILRKYADKIEQWGLDEAFLDVSSRTSNFEEAKKLAEKIKHEIREKEQLTCSIGVASNKLLAKIASDFKKPEGLTVVEESDAERFLAPLPVRKLLWVGKKTERTMNEMGIKTIGDLAAFDVSILTEKFGVMGKQYHLSARGIDKSEVAERSEAKSVGREVTYEEDTTEINLIHETLNKLAQEICTELAKRKLLFKTITIKIRYSDFETHTRSKTLYYYTNNLHDLQKTARDLTQSFLSKERKIGLIGLKTSNFTSSKGQKTLA